MKFRLLALVLVLALLTACGATYPDADRAGNPWNEAWTMLGGDFGIADPAGFTIYDNNMALAANDMYMVSWVSGDQRDYVNPDGDTVPCYDAEVYALLITYEDAASAKEAVDEWVEQAGKMYVVDSTATETHNGQDYTVVTYTYEDGADTPYDQGASAFAAFDKYGVTVELFSLDGFEPDPLTLLQSVLDGCHVDAESAE